MSFKKIVMSSVVAATVATSSFAATINGVDAGGHGNYLLMPAYYATSAGWTTDIRVVNDNTTAAVVAKVVVREYATSQELLDFPIYLSPGDVWVGKLAHDGSKVLISSTDDSSPVVPSMSQELLGPDYVAAETKQYGYVEIIALGEANATSIDSTWSQYKPLDKAKIKTSFEGVANKGGSALGVWRAPENNLFGQMVVSSENAGAEKSMTRTAVAVNAALVNVVDTKWTNINPFQTDTALDAIWASGSAANIASLFVKDSIQVVNYTANVEDNQLILTQPFKNRLGSSSVAGTYPYVTTNTTAADPYTTDVAKVISADHNSTFGFYYMTREWDNAENTAQSETPAFSGGKKITKAGQCPTEICYLVPNNNNIKPEGWVNFDLGTTENGAIQQYGVPVVPTFMTGVKVNGVGVVNLIQPAYKATNN